MRAGDDAAHGVGWGRGTPSRAGAPPSREAATGTARARVGQSKATKRSGAE
jgi:hypothetical protein